MNSIHRIRLVVLGLLAIVSLISVACGGGGGTVIPPPPPVGPFSVSNLNGQYAFVTNGEIFPLNLGTTTAFARTGSFTADGKGTITGGIEDANTLGFGTTTAAITGGSYTVNPDGRGTLSLTVNGATLQFSIALTSASDGLMVDFTSNGNQASIGSGNFFKQDPSAFSRSGISGNYVFDFAGTYPDGSLNPSSVIGQLNSDGAGILTGIEDPDIGGALAQQAPITIANTSSYGSDPASVSSLADFGRGVATIDDGIVNGNPTFVFYIVNRNRVRFLSSSAAGLLVGDAVAQANVPLNTSSFNGGFVFALGGTVFVNNIPGPISRLGRFTAAGANPTSVLVDTNTGNKQLQTNSATNGAITIDGQGTGRGTITFKDPNQSTPYKFIFYLSSPASGVIQDVTGTGIIADGSLTAQTGGPFSGANVAGVYAFNWSGQSIQTNIKLVDEEDVIGQVTVSSLGLKGAEDSNQFSGGPVTDAAVSGTITLAGDGTGGDGMRSSMKVTLTKGSSTNVNFVTYVLSPGVVVFASTDSNRVVIGILKSQPATP